MMSLLAAVASSNNSVSYRSDDAGKFIKILI